MASATVGVLRVLLTANSAEFDSAMKKAAGAAQLWSKDLQNIGRQATQVGSALTKTLTLPILALGVGSVKAAMDFESSFANVAKTVDGVSDKFGKLTPKGEALAATFRQMAKEIPATTDELNKIAALGGQMGVPIDQLDKFTRNVAALGVAVDNLSTEEAAAGLAQIGNIAGEGTVNIDKYASALVHLGNNSNATEGDILEFTKRLMGAGDSVGMTVPQVMALGTAMANVGINAEAGGTAMSTVINKISKAVSAGGESLKEFATVANMSGEQFAATWKSSPIEAIDAFVKGLGSMKDRGVDLNLTMGELGTEGIRVADTLKRLAGAGDGVSKALVLANEGYASGNKHLEEAAKKYATTANQMKILWNQITDIGITLGNALLPAIKSMISALSSLMPIIEGIARGFGVLPGPVQAIIVGFGLALAAAGPLLLVFGQLMIASSALTGAFAKKAIGTRALSTAFDAMQGPMSSLTAWFSKVGTAVKTSDMAMLNMGISVRGVGALLTGAAVPLLAFGGAAAYTYTKTKELREEFELLVAASKLADKWINDVNEARRIMASQAAGAAGKPLAAQPFQPFTLDVAKVYADAAGPLEKYEGQVLKVGAALQSTNRHTLTNTSLTIDQLAAAQAMTGGAQALSGSVLQIGTANTTASKGSSELGAKLDKLTADIKEADKQIAGLSKTTREQLTAAFKSGAFSVEELKKETGLSEVVLERFKKQLQDGATAHKASEKATKDHTKELEKYEQQLESLRQETAALGLITENDLLKAFADIEVTIRRLTAAGIPLDEVLVALTPRMEALRLRAQASGIDFTQFAGTLVAAKEAVQRLAEEASKSIPSLPILEGLSQIPGTMVAISTEAELTGAALTESFHKFGLKTRAEMEQTARESISHFKFLRDSGTASADEIALAYDRLVKMLQDAGFSAEEIAEKLRQAGVKGGESFGTGMKNALVGIAPQLVTILGNALTSGPSEHKWEEVGTSIGALIGGALLATAGPIGASVGAMIGGMIGGEIGKWLDLTDYEKRIRALRQSFDDIMRREFGTANVMDTSALIPGGLFTVLTEEGQAALELLRRQFAFLGVDIDEALRTRDPKWIQQVLDDARQRIDNINTSVGGLLGELQTLGHGLPASLREYISGLETAGILTQENIDLLATLAGDGEADWRKIQEAVERYGGDISKLGGAFQAQRLHDSWQQIIDDIALFEKGGMSAVDILNLTKDKIKEVAQESIRFGTEIPENMRPYIEALIKSGDLVDENGEKITDIGKLKFGETLQTSLQKLTDEIKRLIDTLGGVPAAAQTAAKGAESAFNNIRPTIRVGVEYDDPGHTPTQNPSTASTGGYVTPWGIQYRAIGGMIQRLMPSRGRDTVPAMLSPGEFVMNPMATSVIGPRQLQAWNHGIGLKASGVLAQSGLGGGRTGSFRSVTILEIDKREVGRAVADVLPGELRRLGVRVRA